MLLLDNTKRSCYETCPRKYYYTFNRNLVPVYGSNAIRYGVCFHAGLEAFYSKIKEEGYKSATLTKAIPAAVNAIKKAWEEESKGLTFYEDYRNITNLLNCFSQYITNYSHEATYLEVVETERVFNIPIEMPPEMFFGMPNFVFAGKIDAEVKLNGQKWNLEHKTTSQNIFMQEQRLQRSPQIIGYDYVSKKEGRQITGTLVNFHYIKAGKLKAGGYGKLAVDFKRVPQIFTTDDHRNWLESLCQTAFNIMRSEQLNSFPMKFDSCFQYGACSYANLCRQNRPLGEELTEGYIERLPWDSEISVGEEE